MKAKISGKLLYILLPIGILVGGFVIAKVFIETAPKAAKMPKETVRKLVEVQSFTPGEYVSEIFTNGRVEASSFSKVTAEVTGKVIWVSPSLKPGQRVKKGEVLFKIDKSDYENALAQKQAAYVKAQADLELELGKADVAKKEFALLKEMLPNQESALALREPQLKQAKAMVQSAKAELQNAKNDLAKTSVKAPISGIIESKDISVGGYATASTQLFSLIGTDSFWIQTDVREGDLPLITFGESKAFVTPLGEGYAKEGVVLSYYPSVEESTQKIRVLIEIKNPLENSSEPVFAGSFVDIRIEGASLTDMVKLPWGLVRNGDNIWLYEDGKLVIKPLDIAFRNRDYVLAKGIKTSDKIITTNLNSPAPETELRMKTDKPKTEKPKEDKQ